MNHVDKNKFASSSFKDFEGVETIFSSHAGSVYLARFRYDGNKYILKERKTSELGKRKSIMNEVSLLSQLDDDHVVRCLGHFFDDKRNSLFIVLEYCNGGDLYTLLQRRKTNGKLLDEQDIWVLFHQICLGVKHLHENGIVHRDLKTMNIMGKQNWSLVKIADLGVSRQVSDDTMMLETFYGTPLYLSPELVDDKPYNEKTDIWSLGIILYEMACLKAPFEGKNLLSLAKDILQAHPPRIPRHFTSDLERCINWLLQKDYSKRPNIMQLLNFVSKRLPTTDPQGYRGFKLKDNVNVNGNGNDDGGRGDDRVESDDEDGGNEVDDKGRGKRGVVRPLNTCVNNSNNSNNNNNNESDTENDATLSHDEDEEGNDLHRRRASQGSRPTSARDVVGGGGGGGGKVEVVRRIKDLTRGPDQIDQSFNVNRNENNMTPPPLTTDGIQSQSQRNHHRSESELHKSQQGERKNLHVNANETMRMINYPRMKFETYNEEIVKAELESRFGIERLNKKHQHIKDSELAPPPAKQTIAASLSPRKGERPNRPAGIGGWGIPSEDNPLTEPGSDDVIPEIKNYYKLPSQGGIGKKLVIPGLREEEIEVSTFSLLPGPNLETKVKALQHAKQHFAREMENNNNPLADIVLKSKTAENAWQSSYSQHRVNAVDGGGRDDVDDVGVSKLKGSPRSKSGIEKRLQREQAKQARRRRRRKDNNGNDNGYGSGKDDGADSEDSLDYIDNEYEEKTEVKATNKVKGPSEGNNNNDNSKNSSNGKVHVEPSRVQGAIRKETAALRYLMKIRNFYSATEDIHRRSQSNQQEEVGMNDNNNNNNSNDNEGGGGKGVNNNRDTKTAHDRDYIRDQEIAKEREHARLAALKVSHESKDIAKKIASSLARISALESALTTGVMDRQLAESMNLYSASDNQSNDNDDNDGGGEDGGVGHVMSGNNTLMKHGKKSTTKEGKHNNADNASPITVPANSKHNPAIIIRQSTKSGLLPDDAINLMHDGIVANELLFQHHPFQVVEKMSPDAFKKERARRSLFHSCDIHGTGISTGNGKDNGKGSGVGSVKGSGLGLGLGLDDVGNGDFVSCMRPKTVPTKGMEVRSSFAISQPTSPRRLPRRPEQPQPQQRPQHHEKQPQHKKKLQPGECIIPRQDLHEAVSLEAVQGIMPQPKPFKAQTEQERDIFGNNINGPQAFPRAKRVTSRRGLLDKPAILEAGDRKSEREGGLGVGVGVGVDASYGSHAYVIDDDDDYDDVGKSKARIKLERQQRQQRLAAASQIDQ